MAYGDLKVNNLIYDTGSGDATRSVVSIPQIASPTFTGTPAAPTAAANTNTTQIATTAFVMTELGDYLLTATAASTYAPLAAPAFTGTATGVNLTLSGNLTVNGTTTTIDTTTLDVEDKNITLGKVSTPTDTTADGGGITLKGATDKTITWTNATDSWDFNQKIDVDAGSNTTQAIFSGSGGSGSRGLAISTEAAGAADEGVILNARASGTTATMKFQTNSATALTLAGNGGNATFAGTVSDSKGNLRSIPINFHNAGTYTLVAADAGKVVSEATMGANITVPASVFAGGDAVTIMNHTGNNITLTQGSGVTMYNAADASTGNRTLAGRGFATLFYREHNVVYISGAGLS